MPARINDRSWQLAGTTRDWLGAAFAADLDGVVLVSGPAADRLNADLGSLACAFDGRIFLRSDAPGPATTAGRWLLAHEAAHLLQQRLPPPADPAGDAEQEACQAADAALRGQRFRCRVTLPAELPACYVQPGHYYTTYILALAAGLERDLAYKIAVYCQLPDMVSELDAAVGGFNMFEDKHSASAAPLMQSLGNIAQTGSQAHQSQVRDPTLCRQIQVGLHALSGEVADTESKKRAAILDQLTPGAGTDTVVYGLAMHALGDSYAHRDRSTNPVRMYQPLLGHMWDGEGPDDLSSGRDGSFMAYVRVAYEKLRKAAGALPARADVAEDQLLGSQMKEIANHNWDMDRQVHFLRNLASQIGAPLMPFAPEAIEPIPMLFRNLPVVAGVPINYTHIDLALRCARLWSAKSASDFADGTTKADAMPQFP